MNTLKNVGVYVKNAWVYVKKVCTRLIERKLVRVTGLVIFAYVGFRFASIGPDHVTGHFAEWHDYVLPDDLKKYFFPLFLSLPVVTLLWFFRTYDTRQNIEKAETQIQQGNFVTGLNKLVGKDLLPIEVGTHILLTVSKETKKLDKQIRLAFVKRLKKCPENVENKITSWENAKNHNSRSMHPVRLSYAQHILEWLIKYQEENETEPIPDLKGMDLRAQDFKTRGDKRLSLWKILPKPHQDGNGDGRDFNIKCDAADCESVDFFEYPKQAETYFKSTSEHADYYGIRYAENINGKPSDPSGRFEQIENI